MLAPSQRWCSPAPCAFALSHRRRARVVIVGSSPDVLDSALGHAVDTHDTVVRLNCAPTIGLERHVGSRTSFRVVNRDAEPWQAAERNSSAATIVALPVHPQDNRPDPNEPLRSGANVSSAFYESMIATHARCRASSPLTGHRSAFVEYDFLLRLRRTFGVDQPTTGFTAIALFSRLFTRPVALHGFSFYVADENATQHYWNETDLCGNTRDTTMRHIHEVAHKFHNASREREVVLRMAADGMVTFLGQQPSTPRGGATLGRESRTGKRQSDETCLAACLPTRPPAAGGKAQRAQRAHESCRWRPPSTASVSRASASVRGGEPLRVTRRGLLASGCLPPPECCLDFLHLPRSGYKLYRRVARTARFVWIGVGYCHRGFYTGWLDDPKHVRDSLSACQAACASEERCRYVAFLQGKSCSRYGEQPGEAASRRMMQGEASCCDESRDASGDPSGEWRVLTPWIQSQWAMALMLAASAGWLAVLFCCCRRRMYD